MKKFMTAILMLIFSTAFSAHAETIGEVTTSGVLFKDSVKIHAVDDPTIAGVTCYVTTTDRSLSFEDQTDSSIACRQVGPIKGELTSMKNVFSQSKNMFFKTQIVDRFWDPKRKVLIYLSYTKKLKGDNVSHAISVVPVNYPLNN